jgi:multidrug efflux system membrane fusion protein
MMMKDRKGLLKRLVAAACLFALPFAAASCGAKKEPQKPRSAPVRTAAAVQKDVPLEMTAIGEMEAFSSVAVRPQVDGPVLKVHFSEGQYVEKGELLFTIDPRPFEVALRAAEAQLARDKAQADNAAADAGRYEELVRKGYVAQSQYEQFRAAAEALQATVRADAAAVENAKLTLGYCYIRAPFAGKTGSTAFDSGNIVRAGDSLPLVTIYQVEPIYASFTLPEQSLPLVRNYMAKGGLTVRVSPGAASEYEGKLTFVDNAVDRATGTIRLKATLRNSEKALWPGQFVNVVLRLDVEKGAVVVPSQAVMTGQTGEYVFVVKDGKAEERRVEAERTYGNETVIRKGVAPGDEVVTDGQLQLVPGMNVEIKQGSPGQGK